MVDAYASNYKNGIVSQKKRLPSLSAVDKASREDFRRIAPDIKIFRQNYLAAVKAYRENKQGDIADVKRLLENSKDIPPAKLKNFDENVYKLEQELLSNPAPETTLISDADAQALLENMQILLAEMKKPQAPQKTQNDVSQQQTTSSADGSWAKAQPIDKPKKGLWAKLCPCCPCTPANKPTPPQPRPIQESVPQTFTMA